MKKFISVVALFASTFSLAGPPILFKGDQAALLTNKLVTQDGLFQIGTVDPYGRTQIWNKGVNASLRLGSLSSDGDPTDSTSEGIIVYGKNVQGDSISSPNFSYARIKNDRFGIYNSQTALADYIFRVDGTSLYLKDNLFAKTFEIVRATGNTTLSGALDVGTTARIRGLTTAGYVYSDVSGNLSIGATPGTPTFTYPKGSLTSGDVGKFLMEDSGVAAVYAQTPAVPATYDTWTIEITGIPSTSPAAQIWNDNDPGSIAEYGTNWSTSGTVEGVAANLETAWDAFSPSPPCGQDSLGYYATSTTDATVTFTCTVGGPAMDFQFQDCPECDTTHTVTGAEAVPAKSEKSFLGTLASVGATDAVINAPTIFTGIASGAISGQSVNEGLVSIVDGTHVIQQGSNPARGGKALYDAADTETVVFRAP